MKLLKNVVFDFFKFRGLVMSFSFTPTSEIYIWSAPNNSNETYTFMCLGRAGSAKTALKFKYEI